jgi:transcriptional regulator with XRE-family HTH domain
MGAKRRGEGTRGTTLRHFREKARQSQGDVAKYLGITNQSVSGWERGVADPSTQHLERLAQFYGVTLDALWKGGTEAELIAANEGEVEAVTGAEVGNIRERLKQAMAEKGIDSAPALAGVCDLKESTARSYINGTRSPPLEVCMEIGQALGVSGDWLFHGTGPHEAEGLARGHTVEARLAVAQAELRFLREKVADLRRDRDAWRALAERLAGKLTP